MVNINDNSMNNVIVDMIYSAISDIKKNEKIDKDKLEILSSLIFEHIFHRTNVFISDELNEFRAHEPRLNKHQKYIEWSIPILSTSQKIIAKLKQLSIVFSLLFTILMTGYQVYKSTSDYFGVKLEIVQKEHNTTKQINNRK